MKNYAIICLLSLGAGANAIDLGRIMPLGDSLTYGAGSYGGYRLPLMNSLLANGDTFSYVGPWNANSESGFGAVSGNHAGFGGSSVPDLTYGADKTGGGTAAGWTATYQPDTILLMAGTNAVAYGDDIRTDMETLLDSIYAAKPDVKIVFSYIPKTAEFGGRTDYNARVNAVYKDIYDKRKAAGQNIWLVDNFTAIDQNTDFIADGIHLDASGYDKVAAGFYGGIQATAVPEPSVLMLVGLGGLGLLRRSHRKQ